jgi:hypothetical protein
VESAAHTRITPLTLIFFVKLVEMIFPTDVQTCDTISADSTRGCCAATR